METNTHSTENTAADENENKTTEATPPHPFHSEDETDALAKECIEVAGTIDDDDASRRYFVATAKFAARNLILELAQAWPEIRDVARKSGNDGKAASAANASLAIKLDLTNLDVLALELVFAVAPWRHKQTASITDDLRQIKLDFLAGTVTRTSESGVEMSGGGTSGEPEQDGQQTHENASPEASEHIGTVSLHDMDRDALLSLAKARNIEVPARARKDAIIELLK